MFKKAITLKTADGLTEPTLHANLFALDRGIVPPERRARVVSWTVAHGSQIRQIMAQHYYFKLLYSWTRRGTTRWCWTGFGAVGTT